MAAAVPSSSSAGPTAGSTVKMSRLRHVVTQRMTDSLQVSAQLATVQRVDITRIAALGATRTGFRGTPEHRTHVPAVMRRRPSRHSGPFAANASINAEAKKAT